MSILSRTIGIYISISTSIYDTYIMRNSLDVCMSWTRKRSKKASRIIFVFYLSCESDRSSTIIIGISKALTSCSKEIRSCCSYKIYITRTGCIYSSYIRTDGPCCWNIIRIITRKYLEFICLSIGSNICVGWSRSCSSNSTYKIPYYRILRISH